MGWKNVKEHYGLNYIVKVEDGVLHVGSAYVGNLITVTPEGVATINRTFSNSPELKFHQETINGNPALFRALMASPDTFVASIPVYTWHEGEIVETFCEEFGWPNVTHDGKLMYENTFFLERGKTIERACRDARSAVEAYERHVREAREDLAQREALLNKAIENEAALKALAMTVTLPVAG